MFGYLGYGDLDDVHEQNGGAHLGWLHVHRDRLVEAFCGKGFLVVVDVSGGGAAGGRCRQFCWEQIFWLVWRRHVVISCCIFVVFGQGTREGPSRFGRDISYG